MCGICGFLCNRNGFSLKNILKNMTDVMKHRGPDESGFFLEENVGLGHRRLSIIDIEGGKQPLFSENERFVIVFNGEIYNYLELRRELEKKGESFKTKSDTEVLLKLFENEGIKFLKKLRGMFAFAIYDRYEKKLFFARDRLGKKPLFFYIDKNEKIFIFASEIKAILKHPLVKRDLNIKEVVNFLRYRYVPSPETFFKDIKKVLPGYYGEIGSDLNISFKKYWEIPEQIEEPRDFYEAKELIEYEIKEAVKLRLRSDVGFGAFLSGGIDSSLVVALMSEFGVNPLKTFSVGYDVGESELKYARLISKKFNTIHNEIAVNYEDYLENLEKLIYLRDAPVTEPADVPIYIMSKMASKSVKMVLSGEGSDEIFGGYPKYIYDRISPFFKFLPGKMVRKIADFLPFRYRKVRVALNSLSIKNEYERFLSWFFTSSNEEMESMLSSKFKEELKDEIFTNKVLDFLKENNIKGDYLYKMLFIDLKFWLPDNLLERGDRMTMGASIEGRCPFMDNVLVEKAMKLPSKFKIKGFQGKYILKKIAEKYLPYEIVYRRKAGFPTPIELWFRYELKKWVLEILKGNDKKIYKFIDSRFVDRILNEHMGGEKNRFREIWILLNFELFLEKNFIQV